MSKALAGALFAAEPHPSLGPHADTYGRLIGSWFGEVQNYRVPDAKPASIEIHFSWALDGRAVQDAWITPARKDRDANARPLLDWYGTTLRVFDPEAQCWRTRWFNPVKQLQVELEGRRLGDDIVQIGTRGGRPIKWTFSEVRPESFHWQAHILEVDGVTWKLELDIHMRRTRD